MPKSRLNSTINIEEVRAVEATKEDISVETVTQPTKVVKTVKFVRKTVMPGVYSTGSIATDRVEYDTYVRWTILCGGWGTYVY